MTTTIAPSPELADRLQRYREQQDDPPSLDALVEEAVRSYLDARIVRRARGPLRITPAERGSGRSDISINHDRYLAERWVGSSRAVPG